MARVLDAKPATIRRYRSDWKRQPPNFHLRYELAQRVYRDLSRQERQHLVTLLAIKMSISQDTVSRRLSQPWGLRQLVSGQWHKWITLDNTQHLSIRNKAALFVQQRLASDKVRYLVEMPFDPDYDPLGET